MWCGQAQTFKQIHLTHTHAQTNKAEPLVLNMKCEQSNTLNLFSFLLVSEISTHKSFSTVKRNEDVTPSDGGLENV